MTVTDSPGSADDGSTLRLAGGKSAAAPPGGATRTRPSVAAASQPLTAVTLKPPLYTVQFKACHAARDMARDL